jgi:penicillin-binding protein 1C
MTLRRRAAVAVLGVGGLALGATAVFVTRPLPPGLLDRTAPTSIRITDRNGALLRELLSRQDGRAIALPGGRVPPAVAAAFLAAEDARFHRHFGIDPAACARALGQNVRARRVVSGASTLTQQLARQLVPRPRTLAGKVQEALWALRLTAQRPRRVLLAAYLDRVALGNGIHGVEAAAETYFGRPASRLSVAQAALLAGMARSPARFDPYRHPQAARSRMRRIVRRMAELGHLSDGAAGAESDAALDLVPPARAFAAPHFTTALAAALGKLGIDAAASVTTTLDLPLQAEVEALVRSELAGLRVYDVGQAAVLVLDNASGEVLAHVGSADFFDGRRGGQNDGVRARRQPGSALKPFVYGAALARGWTASTVLSDVEAHVGTPTGAWMPRNYDRRLHGPVRLRAALANSYNLPAVRVAEGLGAERSLQVLRSAGFASLEEAASHYGAGLVLGNGDVTLREMARAYRGLARGGVLEPVVEVRSALAPDGRALAVPPEIPPRRFLPAGAVALLTDILADEGARAPAFGLDNALRLPFPAAVKTGTSRAHVDNWTVGFTRERTVAVWVGNFDGEPMRAVSGITGAGPLFRRVMLRAMRGIRAAPLVDRSRFHEVDVCALSGDRAGPACPGRLREIFLPGSAPHATCGMHRSVAGLGIRTDVGPAFHTWARAEGLEAGPWPEPAPSLRPLPETTKGVRLLLPQDGDEYLIEPGIPMESQTIPVRVVAAPGVARIELRCQGEDVRLLEAPFATRLPARRGRHRLELWVPGAAAPAAAASFRVR